MSGNRTGWRFALTLFFAFMLMVPQSMAIAQVEGQPAADTPAISETNTGDEAITTEKIDDIGAGEGEIAPASGETEPANGEGEESTGTGEGEESTGTGEGEESTGTGEGEESTGTGEGEESTGTGEEEATDEGSLDDPTKDNVTDPTSEKPGQVAPTSEGGFSILAVNYCDYSQKTGAGNVWSWLNEAPEGSNTDCMDVDIPVEACGSLNIPFESRVTNLGGGYHLLWAEGTSIPADDSLWKSSWPITFSEDYNGGSANVIVFIGGPEDDYYHFADEDPYPYPYPNAANGSGVENMSLGGGVAYTILTDCIKNIDDPGLPTPIDPAVCQVSYAGYTKFVVGSGVTDRVKVGGDENGEINGDGWASTMRLYGATRDDLTDVTLTWTMVGGGSFGALDGTVSNPGAGALGSAGYTVPVVNPVISADGNTITVTIDSMPANSSFSFNVGVVPAEGQTAMYVHSWMLGDLTDCTPAVLDLPEITESVCDENYQATTAKVVAPANSESLTYSPATAENTPDGLVFSFTATVNRGYTLEGATAPAGWTIVSASEATYTSAPLPLADCEVPLTPVTPDLPVLVAATCDDANSPVAPTLQVPTTEGITYGEVQSAPANSVKLSLTATADAGYTFAGVTMPEGWTMISSSEAIYELIAEEATCPTPSPSPTAPVVTPTEPVGTPTEPVGTPAPGTPTAPVTPGATEEPKADPTAAAVKGLPETGTGTNPASMIGLAAIAAAAIAGAGIFVTNRKR